MSSCIYRPSAKIHCFGRRQRPGCRELDAFLELLLHANRDGERRVLLMAMVVSHLSDYGAGGWRVGGSQGSEEEE